jgi:UDPglucose--hexose-1-phosphate uridylyltransferase
VSDDAFRFDVLTGAHVAVVPGRRGAWPRKASPTELPVLEGRCPFCPGHEADTEATVAVRARTDGVPGWRIRVVENIYPLARRGAEEPALVGGDHVAPRGTHEVVIEHPAHDLDMADYDALHLADVLAVYRDRARALAALDGVRTVSVFRNRGRRAGSSQPHPHGQLVAAPVVSPDVVARHDRARAHVAAHGTSLLDDLLARELSIGTRVVEEREHFVALCPFAPRQNHHVMIVPRDARGSFLEIDDARIAPLAEALLRVLRRLRRAAFDPAYNLVVRMPPLDAPHDDARFWFLDVLPRRGGGAGYELATGIDVVTVTPERAAEELRAATPE